MSLRRVDIATDVETISNVQSQRVLVNRSIQRALERIFEYFDWPYYMQEGAIETIDDYTTGTVQVVNGSKTVLGTLTTWTSAMVGRKFRVQDEKPYYRITAVDDVGTLTLEQNYQGSSNTGLTYIIYKDEYRLAADVDKYKTIRQLQSGVVLMSLHPTRFDEAYPTPQSYADPIFEIMVGTKLDIYSTGTVTITGKTITGIGTGWTSVEGLGRMSNIRIGNDVYTVKSVDSATQITIYETGNSVTVVTAYEITLSNLVAQLYQIPNAQRLLYYRYFRIPAPLVNDYDIPDMPHQYHRLLMYGALSEVFLQKGDINKAQIESETRFIDGLNNMKLKLGSFTPDRNWRRKSVDRLRGRRIAEGIEPASFDRRYSSP